MDGKEENGAELDKTTREQTRKMLKQSWGVTDRASADEALEELLDSAKDSGSAWDYSRVESNLGFYYLADYYTEKEALDKALAALGDKVDYAIDVNVPDENIVNRMGGRRACVGCGATYHLVYAPTKTEGICDVCGKELILRDDDKPETVQKRLNVYHEQTQPLIDYYTKAGILKTVDGTVDINDVFAAIVEILGA